MVRPASSVNLFLSRLPTASVLLQQAGWTTLGYGATQLIRLGAVIVLTRLLAPELFGAMILLTALRVGIELFTDLGIGQSVIASPRAREEVFYNTAWTLQLARGFLLGGFVLVALPVFRAIYDDELLRSILPVISVFLILTGVHSVAPMIATKELRTKRIAAYEVLSALSQALLSIGAVLISPTIVGLITGQVMGAIFAAVASYFILPDIRLRISFDRTALHDLITFGKWIFFASIIFFLSGYLDRLMLGKYATLVMLGIYGVARSLADTFAQFGTRMGNAIVFPKIVSAHQEGADLRARVRLRRLQFMTLMMLGIAGLIAVAEPLITILYDARYIFAAQVLPWMAIATWLAIINTLSDSFALGIAKPHITMSGNVAKLATLIAFLPVGILNAGIIGAALAGVGAEISRYFTLKAFLLRERLTFFRQDVALSAGLLALAFTAHAMGQLLAPPLFKLPIFNGPPTVIR